MIVFRGIPIEAKENIALTIGNFDGVHIGHQAMIKRICKKAAELGVASAVMIFEPQPREFFDINNPPPRLTSLKAKLKILKETEIDRVYIVRFDDVFSRIEAKDFVNVILKKIRVVSLLVGDDFRFGAKRMGDFSLLRKLSSKETFMLESMPSLEHQGIRVSSTYVRRSLTEGKMALSKALLGRYYTIAGRIVKGDGVGRKLGYPTANIDLKGRRVALNGIFAVRLVWDHRPPLKGVASLGVRPTVKDKGNLLLEINIFDFNEIIYGKYVTVEFLQKIRDEEKFGSVDQMVVQMALDVRLSRKFFDKRNEN